MLCLYVWNAFAPLNILVSSIHKDSSFFNSFNLCVDKLLKMNFIIMCAHAYVCLFKM